MIPYSLQFSGIRDYKPTKLTFGERDDHILITGPNGTGKSTITFCMGAVLYSAKVDLEGLRSNNLHEDKPWKASIQLTFKNEGPTRIDAPLFIAFKLLIEQPTAHSALQKEFHILTGNTPETLMHTDTYRSGDVNQKNFTTYKEDLQYKYKIHPDLFYLIWYQQEVNQFSTMSPEERFRRFSDMFNITEIQQNWESCIESVKELEEELVRARSIVKSADLELKLAKKELDLFKNNRKRLYENGKNHILYTLTLRHKYEIQKNENEQQLQTNKERLHEDKTKVETTKHQIRHLQSNWQAKSDQLRQKQTQYSSKKAFLEQLKSNYIQLQEEIELLKEQLEETEEKRKQLRFSEKDTIQKLEHAKEKLTSIEQRIEQIIQQQTTVEEQKNVLNQKITEVKFKLEQLENEEKSVKTLLATYKSSHDVQQSINKLQHEVNNFYKQQSTLETDIRSIEEELQQIQRNNIVSKRQQEAIRTCKHAQVDCYTLRDLVQLEKNATVKHEELLNSIKYTIFYDAMFVRPVNDLYYVSLKKIVPDRLITSLPSLKLEMRPDLNEKQQNFATKVLWWIEQFFKNNSPRIEQGILVDARGSRGSQEQNTFILSEAAIIEYKQKLQKTLDEKKLTLQQLQEHHENNTKQLQLMHSVINEVRKAEAFQLQLNKRPEQLRLLEHFEKDLFQLNEQQLTLRQELTELQQENSNVSYEIQSLQSDLDIYEQLGKLKHVQEKLQHLERKQKEYSTKSEDTSKQIQVLQDEIYKLEEDIRSTDRTIGQLNQDVNDTQKNIFSTERTINDLMEKIEIDDANIMQLKIRLEELKSIVYEIYVDAETMPLLTSLSVQELINEDVKARANFENARNEKVNEQAEHNYSAILKDYEQKKNDVATTEDLLEVYSKRAKESEDRLESTINRHIIKIRQLFQTYMDEFQFEGQIEHDRVIDKKGRITFRLFIKVRKAGHKGPLVDVSLKARNGKVAKGVSGGEESLSSLLFALALLQNLNTAPSYIVLDEFDSALDESRKEKVFNLYATELNRKLFILSPKAHDDQYYEKFSKVFVVEHDSTVPISLVRGIYLKAYA